MPQEKWSSRKLFVLILQFALLVLLPIIYKLMDISETVLLMVLGSTSTLACAYLGLNVLQKKYVPADPESVDQ